MNKKERRERVAFYPYNSEMDIICNFRDEMPEYDVQSVILYNNSTINKGNKDDNILFTENSVTALERSDSLVLCDNVKKFGAKGYLRQLKYAEEFHKKVYLGSYLYEWLGADAFQNINVKILNNGNSENNTSSNLLKVIDVPVIALLGEGESCDKLGLMLSINKCLKETGFRVLTISGNSLAKLFKCEVLPAFMYSKEISITEKILKLNYYIYSLAKKYEPDIILISCPGGFMPLNEYENNFFGESAYVISHSLPIDYGIICTYFRWKYGKEYIKEVRKLCKIRFGIDVYDYYMSRQSYYTDTEFNRILYRFYNADFCEKKVTSELEDYYLFDYVNSGRKMTQNILDFFKQNIEII